jgi:ferredoxin
MPKVTFQNEGITVEAERGKSIKEIADGAGINLFEGFWSSYNCSGRGMCLGKGCRVWVLERAPNATSERTFWERIRPSNRGAVRLACQTRVLADLEVRTTPGASLDREPNMKWDPDPRPARWKERLGGGGGADEEESKVAAASE